MLMQVPIIFKPRPSSGSSGQSTTVAPSPRQQQQQGNAGLPGAQQGNLGAGEAQSKTSAQKTRMEMGQIPAGGSVKAEIDLKTAQAINEALKKAPLKYDSDVAELQDAIFLRFKTEIEASGRFKTQERNIEILRRTDPATADLLAAQLASMKKPLEEYQAVTQDYIQAAGETLTRVTGTFGQTVLKNGGSLFPNDATPKPPPRGGIQEP